MADETSSIGPGTVLADRYELTAEIGRGGFGMVFRARQLNMDRDVAIKILPPQFLSVTDVVERFKREARLASRLRHPNTITLHDYGQHRDLLFIVMELLTGDDLADVLKREGRLKQERIFHIARQVLKSLAEAHDEGIVHRDLKPENIFLSVMGDDHDIVKVLDFGIAKLAMPESTHDENHRALTITGSTVGTPTYMSPEQAAGENVDGQTDLYALGVIMYEMLNGRPPFYDRDPVKVMRSHLFEPVPALRDVNLRGTLLDRVVRKALQKEREHRFRTANEFLLALAGEPVARPVIAGVDLASLDEPSTQEFTLGGGYSDGPDTGNIQLDGPFGETLQFANAIAREEDAIPFGIVENDAPREKATVRSSLTETSGLTSDSGIETPPPGFLVPSDKATTSSSILTVIESPANHSESDIILLTTPKNGAVETPSSDDSNEHLPLPPKTGRMYSAESPPAVEDPPAATDERWEWGASIDTAGHDAIDRKSGRGLIWLLVLIVLAAAGATGAYFAGFIQF